MENPNLCVDGRREALASQLQAKNRSQGKALRKAVLQFRADADDDHHYVVFNEVDAYFCSEPQKLRLHTGTSLKEFLAAQKQVLKPTSTLKVASTLNRIIGSADNRVPPFLKPGNLGTGTCEKIGFPISG
jgi:hypothetical protein